jgi:putative ABC transport system permease protein
LLRRSPGFTVAGVVSLALGIGAATAIFQIVDAVRLRTLPVSRPWELARVRIVNMDGARGNRSSPYDPLNNPVFEQIRRQQEGFMDVAAWSSTSFNLADGGEMRLARGLFVSGTFFDVLGLAPAAGRLITDADDKRGCAPRVVLSHAFWTSQMGGDPRAIGRTLTLDSRQAEVITGSGSRARRRRSGRTSTGSAPATSRRWTSRSCRAATSGIATRCRHHWSRS